MEEEKYIEHREKVIEALNEFEMYFVALNALHKDLLEDQEMISHTGYEINMLYILNKSLVFNTLLSMRKLISFSRGDKSLSSFHSNNVRNSKTDNQYRSKEESLKQILPNSLEQYKILKTFVDKKVAHLTDENPLLPESYMKDLELINKDIRNALDEVTLHKEDSSYSFLKEDYAKHAKLFFTKIAKALIDMKK